MATREDYTAIAIGLGALVLLAKWGLPKIPDVIPEAPKDFGKGFFQGEPGPIYLDQEGLSPNPAVEEWYRDFGDIESDQRPAIRVVDGVAVPTPPVMGIPNVTPAQEFGIDLREAFTPGGAWEDFKRDISFGWWGEDPQESWRNKRTVINAYQ
jgi:hypothetical protein